MARYALVRAVRSFEAWPGAWVPAGAVVRVDSDTARALIASRVAVPVRGADRELAIVEGPGAAVECAALAGGNGRCR